MVAKAGTGIHESKTPLVGVGGGRTAIRRVDIWHGLLWSKYKGAVFSKLHAMAAAGPIDLRFIQVCETRSDRAGTPIDLGYHTYPYALLFAGEYDRIPKLQLFWRMFGETWRSRADLVLLGGYGRAENWIQIVAARLSGKSVGVFCDSTLNDHPQTWAKSLLKRLFFAQCRIAFCYGVRSADLAERYGVPPSRIVWPVATAALPDSYAATDVAEQRRLYAPARPRFL